MAILALVHATLAAVALSLRLPSGPGESAIVNFQRQVADGTEQGFRVPPFDQYTQLWARRYGTEKNQRQVADGTEQGSRLPPFDQYTKLWTGRYGTEKNLSSPMPSSIQLVLGVFTVAPETKYREVARKTWLQQEGVCYWRHTPREGCSVYVAFVIGREGTGDGKRFLGNMSAQEVEKTHRERGMLVLDTAENMNGDKSPLWFSTALRAFPWATHVGKLDMDTYPLLHKLLHRMEASQSCFSSHSPYEVIGRPHDTYGPRFAHDCPNVGCPLFVSRQDQKGGIARPGMPWRFFSGEFYVLSMPLLRQVDWSSTGRGGGTEDLQVTTRVQSAAAKRGFCVVLRRLDAWYHRTNLSDVEYSNDLAG